MVIRMGGTDAEPPSRTVALAKERLRVAVEGVVVRSNLQM